MSPRRLALGRWMAAAGAAALLASALPVEEFTTYSALIASPLERLSPRKAWEKVVPEVREVRIRSSADGTWQPALFHAPRARSRRARARARPLLVVLHSWSVDYLDRADTPYGLWAVRNGWVFIHPDYRGRFDDAQATCSELAVQDILDAVAYARAHANVDPDRIYLVGYSGGAMAALTMAGRHPRLWAGVVAWVPVFDLAQWHAEVRQKYPRYARNIRDSCGGEPTPGSEAAIECRRRSPSAHLDGALGEGVRVLISAGIEDPLVLPSHALGAFNALAAAGDRLTPRQIRQIVESKALPAELEGTVGDSRYSEAGRPLLFSRTSGQATLHLYSGRHDVVYNAGLLWLASLRRQDDPPVP